MNKLIISITGASGSIYAKCLLDSLVKIQNQLDAVGIVMSDNAKYVWETELGNKDFETLNQLILANDLRGQIETIVGGTLTESRAKSIQNKYKLEESVITHVNKLIDDYMKEDTTLQILEYGKQLGFKINNK